MSEPRPSVAVSPVSPNRVSGAMTRTMRAMGATSGPKVLRVALLRGGRIVEERLVRGATPVTIGERESATFVHAGSGRTETLFERVGDSTYLKFTTQMTGRIAWMGEAVELDFLRSRAARVSNDSYRLKLTDDVRGKLVIGDITLLFQFVAAPAVQTRAQLPLAVVGGVSETIDWTLTIVAAMSFLVHFGFVGFLYSDWMDPPIASGSVQGLVELVKTLPLERVEEKPETSGEQVPVSEPAPDHPVHRQASQPSQPAKPFSNAVVNVGSKPSTGDAVAQGMAAQAEKMRIEQIATYGGSDTAVQRATDRSNTPAISLNGPAGRDTGVTNDISLGTGGAPIVPGAQKNGLGDVGSKGRTSDGRSGTERPVDAPKPVAVLVPERPAGAGGEVLERDVAKLRRAFKRCYERGLDGAPEMEGRVVIAAKVGANGEVANVSEESSDGGLSTGVKSCIVDVVRHAQFTPRENSGTVRIPVTLRKQK
jgi:outer membrane biosynthesis protein TonB